VLPGGSTSYSALGINNSGQVVGVHDTAGGAQPGFLYSGGTMIDLGTLPGGSYTWVQGINNSGQVVGWGTDASGVARAFLYSGGTNSLLVTGAWGGEAFGINDSGQVVGSANFGYNEAFLYRGGTMLDLNNLVTLPSGVYLTNAAAINDSGQIAALGSDNHAYL